MDELSHHGQIDFAATAIPGYGQASCNDACHPGGNKQVKSALMSK
ncbi:MAG: hypothetical protein WBV55_19030 [Candidatus Sulfotelmatobacter sp.]